MTTSRSELPEDNHRWTILFDKTGGYNTHCMLYILKYLPRGVIVISRRVSLAWHRTDWQRKHRTTIAYWLSCKPFRSAFKCLSRAVKKQHDYCRKTKSTKLMGWQALQELLHYRNLMIQGTQIQAYSRSWMGVGVQYDSFSAALVGVRLSRVLCLARYLRSSSSSSGLDSAGAMKSNLPWEWGDNQMPMVLSSEAEASMCGCFGFQATQLTVLGCASNSARNLPVARCQM